MFPRLDVCCFQLECKGHCMTVTGSADTKHNTNRWMKKLNLQIVWNVAGSEISMAQAWRLVEVLIFDWNYKLRFLGCSPERFDHMCYQHIDQHQLKVLVNDHPGSTIFRNFARHKPGSMGRWKVSREIHFRSKYGSPNAFAFWRQATHYFSAKSSFQVPIKAVSVFPKFLVWIYR